MLFDELYKIGITYTGSIDAKTQGLRRALDAVREKSIEHESAGYTQEQSLSNLKVIWDANSIKLKKERVDTFFRVGQLEKRMTFSHIKSKQNV
jgi:hypothetical protein